MTNDNTLISELIDTYGETISTSDLRAFAGMKGMAYSTLASRLSGYKTGRGTWNLQVTTEDIETIENSFAAPAATVVNHKLDDLVPPKDSNYVPFGCYKEVKKILASNMFYPVFITGLSGNGKTLAVEQACAHLKRELIRFNVTIETDSDDLIGGFRLEDGTTKWHDGPVVEAMERGAVLLLDECDLASNKIMVIQSVLEGKPLFLKKIGKVVKPKEGFNIIATANTKGKGSDDGRFIGTNVLNEAFLERFSITLEQPYPSESYESKILTKYAKSLNISKEESTDFIKRLVRWSDNTRKTFMDGGINELISTRRLVHVLKAYSIFGNKATAVKLCVSRFDDEVKSAFVSTYDKIDATFRAEEEREKKQNELEEESEDVKKKTDEVTPAGIDPVVEAALEVAKRMTAQNTKLYGVTTSTVTASTPWVTYSMNDDGTIDNTFMSRYLTNPPSVPKSDSNNS